MKVTDRTSWMAAVLSVPIKLYQRLISPFLPPRCRFYPSCSAYALEALQQHGPLRGSWLSAKRICRCHPFHPGGVDQVPDGTAYRAPDTN